MPTLPYKSTLHSPNLANVLYFASYFKLCPNTLPMSMELLIKVKPHMKHFDWMLQAMWQVIGNQSECI